MENEYQKICAFLFDRLTETAAVCGIAAEGEGGIPGMNGNDLRLRVGFHGFTIRPSSDCGHVIRGEILAEILYVPGEKFSADILADQILSVFRPGYGEVRNLLFRVLISGARILDLKNEGKYLRTGLSLDITAWKTDEF